MVGEELGLWSTLGVVICFVVFALAGMTDAMNSRDRFGMILATGIVLLITIQAALNIGVTTGVLPNSGLPLPFVSYGGSEPGLFAVGVGILLSIFRLGMIRGRLDPVLDREDRSVPSL